MNEKISDSPHYAVKVVMGFALGAAWVQQCSDLPPVWGLALVGLLAVLMIWKRWLFVASILIGVAWAAGYGMHLLQDRLPTEGGRREALVEGQVITLPNDLERGTRFDFNVDQVIEPSGVRIPKTLRLSWYERERVVRAGERWRLRVSLRPLHGMVNPGGFDYEGWLFAEGIEAVGYVRGSDDNHLLKSAAPGLTSLRQTLRDRIAQALGDKPMTGVVMALALGDESGISSEQWDVFRRTGTAHLVAVSGSHIGLVAGLVFYLVRRAHVYLGVMRGSPPGMAALAAVLAAWMYSALSGFAIPAQRAAIMVTVAMGAIILRRNTAVSHVMALAALAVLIHDPLAVVSPGFWLSFGAVALIALAMSGRMRGGNGLRAMLRINWVTALGLAPLLLLFFGQVSLVSPLANLLAVPVLGTLLIPVCLLGALLLLIIPAVGIRLLQMAASLLSFTWPALEWLSGLSWAQWTHAQPPFWGILLALLGGVLLLAPRGIPARWLGLVLMLPAVLYAPTGLAPGAFRMTLLDVGQGLAAVVETRHRTLVFDAGARLSPGFDMGRAVIVPYLRFRGLDRLDTLIVSHGDNDHAGGARSLLAEFPAGVLYTSAPAALAGETPELCAAGQNWDWDGVHFAMLGPVAGLVGKENDNSCVLKVSTTGGSVLFTGDIERAGESALIKQWGDALRSDAIIVPHHGSKTSSTIEFLKKVQPRLALFPVGYLNRFGFPVASVVDRYQQMGADMWSTATMGAVTLDTRGDKLPMHISGWRQSHSRYWGNR